MAGKETLRTMLNNYINDNTEQAQLDLHDYLANKMREVAGFTRETDAPEIDVEDDMEIIDTDDDSSGLDTDTDE